MLKNLSIIYIIIVLFSSCDYITDLKRTGDEIIIPVFWEGSPNIDVRASCRLVLINSEEYALEVKGMDFIAEGYYFNSTPEKLIIKHSNPNRLQQEKVAEILVYAPVHSRITINSPCHITNSDTLNIENLTIVVNGKGLYTTGDLLIEGNHLRLNVYGGINKSRHTLSGKVNSAYYFIEGGTDIDALELEALNTTIIHRSFGDCHVAGYNQLNVTIFSTGSVFYTGEPDITFIQEKNNLMNASGALIKIEDH